MNLSRALPSAVLVLAVSATACAGPRSVGEPLQVGALSQEFRDLRARGQVSDAIALADDELARMERLAARDDPRLYQPTMELLQLYAQAPDPPASRPHLERLLRITERAQAVRNSDLAGPYLGLHGIAMAVRDYAFAEEVLSHVQAQAAPDAPPGLAARLRAQALELQGDTENAAKQYESVPGAELEIALVRGDYARAETLLGEAVARIDNDRNAPGDLELLTALVDLIGVQQRQGGFDRAWRTFERARREQLALDARMRLELGLGDEPDVLTEAFFRWELDAALSLYVGDSAAGPDSSRRALESVLRWKGALIDAAIRTRQLLHASPDPEIRRLASRYDALQSSLATLSLAKPQAGETEVARMDELHGQARRVGNTLLRKLESEGVPDPTVPSLAEVRKAIPRDAALLEFVVYSRLERVAWNADGQSRYAVFILRRRGDPVLLDLGSAREVDAAASALRAQLEAGYGDAYRATAAALFNLVIAPCLPHLHGLRHVLIAPDGPLRVTPFAALIDQDGAFLIQRLLLTQIDSGRDLVRLYPDGPRETATVIADPAFGAADSASARRVPTDIAALNFAPLPGAAEEGRQVTELLPNAQLISGPDASETRLRTLQGPAVLHLATHGFFFRDGRLGTPGGASRGMLTSGLALAGFNRHEPGTDDGFLAGLEASALDLRGTQLVTLSACETGLGELHSLDGVYGIRRGFQLAGAEALLMTLWTVGDTPTRNLMTAYYRNLLAGRGRSEALRQAQLGLITDPDWSHPFNWAGIVLVGRWQPADLDKAPAARRVKAPDTERPPVAVPKPGPAPPRASSSKPASSARPTRNIRLKPVRAGAVWHLKVVALAPDSPFVDLGLNEGDTVTSFDGHPLTHIMDLQGFFAAVGRGTTLTVLDANGNERVIEVAPHPE